MDYSSNVDASLVERRKGVPDERRVGRGSGSGLINFDNEGMKMTMKSTERCAERGEPRSGGLTKQFEVSSVRPSLNSTNRRVLLPENCVAVI